MEKFFEDINCELKANKNKRVVLIAGASSSGKSFCSNMLKEYLGQKNIKAKIISADDYYKGIALTIVQKALLNNNFDKTLNGSVITKIVRNVIESNNFPEKFNPTNTKLIKENLSQIYGQAVGSELTAKIKQEFERINFDEPFAIDFATLSKDINTLLKPNGRINSKDYPFATGEPILTNNVIEGDKYDVFIVEGLYSLRPELLDKLDPNQVITCGIKCDSKTLLARRLSRDIKEGRGTQTPEQIIISFISQALPNYKVYIKPTLSKAQFVFETSISQNELDKKDKTSQVKFQISRQLYNAIQNSNYPVIYQKEENDYYFDEKDGASNYNLQVRIREIDGEASKLAFRSRKNSNDILERSVDEYDLSKMLSQENRLLGNLHKKLTDSGFELSNVVQKNRQVFEFKGINFKLDHIEGVGYFVEFDQYYNPAVINLIRHYGLKNVIRDSYLDIIKKQQKRKKEIELKFSIDKIPALSQKPTHILQAYFNPEKHKDFLCDLFQLNSLENIDSARIRQINGGEHYYLTLKTKGTLMRDEFEIEILEDMAKKLLKNNILSIVEKNRYKAEIEGYVFEFDEYLRELKGLKTVEVEISDKNIDAQRQQINTILGQKLGLKGKDITNDLNYKNKNLGKKPVLQQESRCLLKS